VEVSGDTRQPGIYQKHLLDEICPSKQITMEAGNTASSNDRGDLMDTQISEKIPNKPQDKIPDETPDEKIADEKIADINVDKSTILGIEEIEAVEGNKRRKYPRLCYWSKSIGRPVRFVPDKFKVTDAANSDKIGKTIIFYEKGVVTYVIYFYYQNFGKTPTVDDVDYIIDILKALNVNRIH